MPIISIGIIAYTYVNGTYKFLMIRRKDTLGFIDFLRGKYSIYNKNYIINLLNEMTVEEKQKLLDYSFNELWKNLWYNTKISSQYKLEEKDSNEKYNILLSGVKINNDISYNLSSLIEESNRKYMWLEPEWGFPKGRRNHNEYDFDCAKREFSEETGYSDKNLLLVNNILPYEEIFIGSNYKSYKHKYYVMMMQHITKNSFNYDKTEVSKVEWKTYDECMQCIRPYNLEKIKILSDIHYCLINYKII